MLIEPSIKQYASQIAAGIAADARLHNPEFARWAAQKLPVWEAFIESKLRAAIMESDAAITTAIAAETPPVCQFNPAIHIVRTEGRP
jgi:hypothetical protein